MSKIAIGYVNRYDGATIAAGHVASNMPVANLTTIDLTERWRSGSTNSSYLTADLGSALACRAFGLFGTNLTSAATIRVRASNTDFTTGDLLDTGTVSAGVDNGLGALINIFSADVTARYWRADLADSSLSYLEAGRAFLGPLWYPGRNFTYGKGITWEDGSEIDEHRTGAVFVNPGARRRVLAFDLRGLTRAEAYDQAFELDRTQGLTAELLAILDPADSTYLTRRAVWGVLRRATPIRLEALNRYAKRYEVRELV